MEDMKRIHVSYPQSTFDILKRVKDRIGGSWDQVIAEALLNYGSIRPNHMYCTKSFDFTEDGKMVVDIVKCLTSLLDVEEYFFAYKGFDKETKKRLPAPRWKKLRVQAVFTAFAYHLATANELNWYWDQTGNHLAEYLKKALHDIGLKWKDIKWVVELVVGTIWSLYPHLWGKQLAVNVGTQVLETLKKKYPGINVRRARYNEDTREEQMIYARLEMLHYAKTGKFVELSPPLCIEGVSVVAEWEDELGEHTYCFSFVD